MGTTEKQYLDREFPRHLAPLTRRATRQRRHAIAAWNRWLADLRARVWAAQGRMCEHGGSKAGERVADALSTARYYERDRCR